MGILKCINFLLTFCLIYFFISCTNEIKENIVEKIELPSAETSKTINNIRINQLGYFPNSVKDFVVVNSNSDSFKIVNSYQQTVFSGTLQDRGFWDKSGENIKTGSFTKLVDTGMYYIVLLPDSVVSYPFPISSDIYKKAFPASLKSYYYQRASIAIEEPYSGKWIRPLAHRDDSCIFHPSTGREGYKPSAKGWYDAGDFSKYTVNAGVTVGTMLAAYEYFPKQFPDNQINIPESGNKISDLLDELKWELDWMLTMQDEDGAAFVKLSDLNWPAMVMPHKSTCDRYFVGKSTAASLNLAATMAKAYRSFKTVDKNYADKMLNVAIDSWNWAIKNDNILYSGTEGVNSGNYPDKDLHEEFIWAAAELYASTGKDEYKDYFMQHKKDIVIQISESWRTFIDNLGYFTIINTPNLLSTSEVRDIQISLLECAEGLISNIDSIPYIIPLDEFVWGSNSDVLNHAIILSEAFRITKNRKYLDAVIQTVDYILGKNATGYSFLTGYGSKIPMFIHHRPSFDDGIISPVPGLLVGGPNYVREDDRLKYGNVVYYDTLPANTYIDYWESWASNEVAINWNSPLVYILAFLEDNKEYLSVESYL